MYTIFCYLKYKKTNTQKSHTSILCDRVYDDVDDDMQKDVSMPLIEVKDTLKLLADGSNVELGQVLKD